MDNNSGEKAHIALGFGFVGLLAFAAFMAYKQGVDINSILSLSGNSAILAFVVLMVIYAIKGLVMFIPIMALYLAAGAIFENFFLGVLVNIAGIVVALTVSYYMGTKLSDEKLNRLYKRYPKIQELSNFQSKNSFFFSYIIRVVGVLPCDVVSLYCGLKGIPYLHFITGSVLGMMPGVILTSLMGASIQEPMSPQFLFSAGFQMFTTCLSVTIYFIIKKRKTS